MKKISLLLLAMMMLVGVTYAQETFQGTLHYSFKITGEGVEAFEAMMPTGLDIAVWKSDSHVEMKGGMVAMMAGRTLVKGKKGVSYMIKDSEEIIYVIDPKAMKEEDETAAEADPVITKEDEIVEIAGFQCQKYKVVQSTAMGEQVAYVWATDKFKMPDNKTGGGGVGSGMVSMKGLNALPLKITMEQGPMSIVISATEVDTNAPDKNLFKLPKGYKKEPFDAEAMMGGMGM